MVLSALIIKARLGLTDEELVEQIKVNPYLLGLPESLDFMPLRLMIGPCVMGERQLPPYSWMGGDHCQNSQSGTFRQPWPRRNG